METTQQQGTARGELVNIVQEYYRTIEAQPYDESRVSPFFAEDYRNYPPRKALPGASVKAATLGLIKALSQGFPDAKRTLLIVEPLSGDRVLVYFAFNGTHTGQFLSFPATGNKVSFIGVDIFTIKDRQFVENHHVEDLTSLFEQLKAR